MKKLFVCALLFGLLASVPAFAQKTYVNGIDSNYPPFAYVDEKTGFFHNAEIIKEHVITPCPVHPDTQEKIEGTLPHWDEVLRVIPELCRYISPLEYLGFDVVMTDSGFKILEINTHQDLHRYPTYNENVHAYFMHKLELKRAGKKLC